MTTETEQAGEHARRMLAELPADLHPDLVPYVRESTRGLGPWVHHPLVISMYHEGMAGWINKAYEQKTAAARKALEARDLHQYVWLYERPYRATALRSLLGLGLLDLDEGKAWSLIKALWIDSENVQEEADFWRGLWADKRAPLCMSRAEREALKALPDPIPVWHGLETEKRRKLGYSWTTKRETGHWFAHRFARLQMRPAWLAKGYAPKAHVRAYLLDRGEWEIIIDPKKVEGVDVTTLKPAKGGR